jgi:glycosyltransferase involved in cell wall biosynthesis
VASLKGIIADELRNERGWVRALLTVQARWERRNVNRGDLVMVTSRYCAEVAQREYGVPPERIAVVPEPIDLEVWDDQFWRASRRPRGSPPANPVVLCVARMYPRKRIGDLLHAAGILRGRVPGVQVRIVGRGPEWPAVSRLRAELGLGESVALLGDVGRERLAEEYVNATVFCLPSVQEGFGIVFLEAAACGVPQVAGDSGGAEDAVVDDVTGVMVRVAEDPREAARAFERLLDDPDLRSRMGEAGRARAVAEFGYDGLARRLGSSLGALP